MQCTKFYWFFYGVANHVGKLNHAHTHTHLVLIVSAPQHNGGMVAQSPYLVFCLLTNIVKESL